MGSQEINHLHVNGEHDKCIEYLEDRLSPDSVEVISRNRVYKLLYSKGAKKARLSHISTVDIHETLLEAGISNIPLFCDTIESNYERDHEKCWHITEWVDGERMNESIRSKVVLREILPDLWYKMGAVLGKIANCKYKDLPIAMTDILWSNFIVAPGDQVVLIDLSKLHCHHCPEIWFNYCIFANPWILREQKEAFIEGYVSIRKKGSVPEQLDYAAVVELFGRRLYDVELGRK